MKTMFSNNVYDKLKFLAQIVLPALGTLYATVSGLYKWPNTEEVVGTVMAVDAFLGILLGLSTAGYNKSDERFDGEINVVEKPDGKTIMDMQLNKHEDPNDLKNEKTVLFRVNSSKAE